MSVEAALADEEDALFAQVLLHNELATGEQVAAGIDLQKRIAEIGARVRLAEILLHQGVVDTRTLDSIHNLQKIKLPAITHPLALRRKGLTPERDRIVAGQALEKGLVADDKLAQAREIQGKLRALGFDRRVGEILWSQGLLAESAIDELLHAEKRRARLEGDETRRLRGRVQVGPISDAEMLFGRLALKNGFLTQEILADATATQHQCRELGVAVKLAEVLCQKKVLTEENVAQIAELMSMEKEQFLSSSLNRVMLKRIDDQALLATLQERGFLTPAQVEETLRVQSSLKALAIERRIGEVLLDRQYVSNEILYSALDDQLRARLRTAMKFAEAAVQEANAGRREPGPAPAAGSAAPAPPAPVERAPEMAAVILAAMPAVTAVPPPRPVEEPRPQGNKVAVFAALFLLSLGGLYLAGRGASKDAGVVELTLPANLPGSIPVRRPDPAPAHLPPLPASGAGRSAIELPADPQLRGVEKETEDAVAAGRRQEAKERNELFVRARSLFVDADPGDLEAALVFTKSPEGVVFEVFGQAPFPDGAEVATTLSFYGSAIPEGTRTVTVKDHLAYARTGPLPDTRKIPAGLYTASIEFRATFDRSSLEEIRATGIAEHMIASFSAHLGTPEEEADDAEQVRAFHLANLARLAEWEKAASAAVEAGCAKTDAEQWAETLSEWSATLKELEQVTERYTASILISRCADVDRQIQALFPPARTALRAIGTAAFGAHGLPIPPEYELPAMRPGEAVIPQENLAAFARSLRQAHDAAKAIDATNALDRYAKQDLIRRLEAARALASELDQTLPAKDAGAPVQAQGEGDPGSPVAWLKAWLARIGALRHLDRGLNELVLSRRFEAEQAESDRLLGYLAELGKVRLADLVKDPAKALPVDLRPLGSAEDKRLEKALEKGWKDLEEKLAKRERGK